MLHLEVSRISAGGEQPRKIFRDDSLKELAASIKEKGVLQPIIVQGQETVHSGHCRRTEMAGSAARRA